MVNVNKGWLFGITAITLLIASGCSSSSEQAQSSTESTGTDTVLSPIEQTVSNPVDTDDNNPIDTGDDTPVDTGDNNSAVDATPDFMLSDVKYQIIEQLGGYPLILTGKQIVAISDLAASTAIDSVELDSIDLTVDVQDETETAPFERIQYTCEQGGQMIVRKAILFLGSAGYSQSVDHAEYIFDQCRLLTGGVQVLNGSMRVIDEIIFDIQENKVDRSVTWTDFTWAQENSSTLAINAEIQLLNSEAMSSVSSREVNITSYELSVDSQLQEAVYGANFLLTTKSSNDGNVQEYALSVNGRTVGPSGVSVMVSTEPAMQRKLVSDGIDVEAVPFNGRILMQADDQSMLALEANAQPTLNNTLQVNEIFTDQNGNTLTLESQNFIDLSILAF